MNRQLTLGGIFATAIFLGAASTLQAAVKAMDNASDAAYAFEADGAWKGTYPGAPPANENPPGNDNGGTGFLPWSFGGGYHEDGGPYGVLNHFIDGVDFPTTFYNDLGAPAFGLGNIAKQFFFVTASASRAFASPLAVGDTVSVDIDTPAHYDDYYDDVGGGGFPFVGIFFNDSAGVGTFGVEAGSSDTFGDFPWRFTDATRTNEDFGMAAGGAPIAPTATSDGSTFSLTILSATTGRATLDGVSLDIGFEAGIPASIGFFLFDNNAEFAPSGDFDDSTVVDTADYNQWKTAFGTGPEGDADGDDDSDGADFLLWQRTFGLDVASAMLPPSGEHAFYFNNLKVVDAGGASAIPEPHSAALAALAAAAIALGAARRRP
jgi:hypothetical protein